MDPAFDCENVILHLNNNLLPLVIGLTGTWEMQIFHKCHKKGSYWLKLPYITLGNYPLFLDIQQACAQITMDITPQDLLSTP